MISNYSFDYFLIGLVLIAIAVGTTQIIIHRRDLNNYKYAIYFIFGGLILILLSTIANSFFQHHWERQYIIAFLFLKNVSKDWLLQHLCSWGYIFLFWGASILIIVTHNKNRGKQ